MSRDFDKAQKAHASLAPKAALPSLHSLMFSVALLMTLAFLTPTYAHAKKLLEIHFLDIGQGDALLLRTPSGRNVLFDLGPPGAGKIIAPYLVKLGIRQIHLLMISHPHLDHYGGWRPVLNQFKIKTYIDPGFPTRNITYRRMLRSIKRRNIRTYVGKQNQILDLGGGARLRILWPGSQFVRYTRSDANSNSLVARLEYKTLRVLLTGDAEAITEKRLLRVGKWLPSHVLKVAHHGSRHSSKKRFLKVVRPRIAVISCGRRNKYRHPHRAAMRRLRRLNVATYVTARHGHIILRSDGNTAWLSLGGKGKSEAVRTLRLKKLKPGKTVTSLTPQHPLAQQPEKRGWIKRKAQGRESHKELAYFGSQKGYVAARGSRVFHRRSCRFAKMIPRRRRRYYRSRRAALRKRLTPASDCAP